MRLRLYTVSILLIASACGIYERRNCYEGGIDCHDSHEANTGSEGTAGAQGVPGPVGPGGASGSKGDTGTAGTTGPQGVPGIDGSDGRSGTDGRNGLGIVTAIDTISVGDVICANGGTRMYFAQDTEQDGLWHITNHSQQIISICNGLNGQPAPASAFTPVAVIDPCGRQGQFDEVLLRLVNGQIMAHYADGTKQFLTLIGPGNYVTTDGTHCYFTINLDLTITGEHN